MNFEDAFRNYQDGKASVEEKAFVLDELARAKAFSSLLDDEGINVTPAPLAEADIRDVRRAKKRFLLSRLLIAASIIALTLVLLATVLGAVFGSASTYANENIKFSKPVCVAEAKQFAFDNYTKITGAADKPASIDLVLVDSANKDFHYNATRLDHSYYVYNVKVYIGDYRIEIDVDTRTKTCYTTEVKFRYH